MPNEEYAQTEFTLEVGDRLLVYTDGLVEAVNARGEGFERSSWASSSRLTRIFQLSSLLSVFLMRCLGGLRTGAPLRRPTTSWSLSFPYSRSLNETPNSRP
jgi:Stage II sporulation protein E (SpoIIE)